MSDNVFPFEPKDITEEQKFWSDVRFYLFVLADKPGQDHDRLFELGLRVPDIDKKEIPEWVLKQIENDRKAGR